MAGIQRSCAMHIGMYILHEQKKGSFGGTHLGDAPGGREGFEVRGPRGVVGVVEGKVRAAGARRRPQRRAEAAQPAQVQHQDLIHVLHVNLPLGNLPLGNLPMRSSLRSLLRNSEQADHQVPIQSSTAFRLDPILPNRTDCSYCNAKKVSKGEAGQGCGPPEGWRLSGSHAREGTAGL